MSDLDESIENMKLDLIKSKYTHQKLSGHVKKTVIGNGLSENKPIKSSTKQIFKKSVPTKSKSGPHFSVNVSEGIRKFEKLGESEEGQDENEDEYHYDEAVDEDLQQMSSYIDYLMERKQQVLGSDSGEAMHQLDNLKQPHAASAISPALTLHREQQFPPLHQQQHPEQPQHHYERDSDSAINNNHLDIDSTTLSHNFRQNTRPPHRTNAASGLHYQTKVGDGYRDRQSAEDILVQWRLRRKLLEARTDVETNHQQHNDYVNSLKVTTTRDLDLDRFSGAACSCQPNRERPEKPVRDETQPVRRPAPVTAEAASQADPCEPDSSLRSASINTEPVVRESTEHQKPKEVVQRSVKMQTEKKRTKKKPVEPTPQQLKKQSPQQLTYGKQALRDGKVQSKKQQLCEQTTPRDSALNTSWDDSRSIGFPDYIDRAIERALHQKLGPGRESSPALSGVTSLSECQGPLPSRPAPFASNEPDQSRPLSKLASAENISEVPWDENGDLHSEDEFPGDAILRGLRQRRSHNLQKINKLKHQLKQLERPSADFFQLV